MNGLPFLSDYTRGGGADGYPTTERLATLFATQADDSGADCLGSHASWRPSSVRTRTVRSLRNESYDGQTSFARVGPRRLDIEIVIDMFNTADRYDIAILMSGDGDFERAVELLRSKGKEIVGVGTRGMISSELENACDRYVKLEDIRSEVEKIR